MDLAGESRGGDVEAQAATHIELAALAQVGLGAIALDRNGRALAVNAAVQFGDGLEMVEAQPRASHRGDQAALAAAIQQALAPAVPDQPPGQRVTLRRPSGRRPLLVGTLSLSGATALMVITDLDDGLAPEAAELQRLFGLTPREAEFAALLATGICIDQAAESMAISRAHARQRLKVIFHKTETHRQAELVALLSRLRGR